MEFRIHGVLDYGEPGVFMAFEETTQDPIQNVASLGYDLERICEEHLAGRYDLEVVDIYQQPTLARDEQIIAAPMLIKKLPAPLQKVIGSMVDREKVFVGLDLRPKDY